ncbi:DUF6503 family protein [Neolewinella litorea]|uniref:DUF2911 domain-containing protein n=1 Tax=Neolewinella litorea TaxID=2562452 RepID=A0A4S4NFX4_9BACT|nr:DUF6503 family protein [Neolewinella litorea]THH34970.1 DUF2911 domain-containing protein [Neolewinella litorea]
MHTPQFPAWIGHFLPVLLFLLLPARATTQFAAPPASQAASVAVTVGYTDMTVSYHRPSVRNRLIFGHLIPYDEVWRAGANENSLLHFSTPVTIAEYPIGAGTYSLYVIPRQDGNWTWILNSKTDRWGAQGYTAADDVLRVETSAERLDQRTETLEYRWMNVGHGGAELVLEWEWYRVRLPVAVDTDARVAREAASHLSPAQDPNDYYEAARYYLETGNLPEAKRWIDRWAAATGPQFGRTRRQALIEREIGNDSLAFELLRTSLALARDAGNDHYVRMNEHTLREWTRRPVDFSPDSLLARSIAYHDPGGNWGKLAYTLTLAESRPGDDTRLTEFTLSPVASYFSIEQQSGGERFTLGLTGNDFRYTYLGQSALPDSLRRARHLTRERTQVLRDYYGYLWGLPMKLTDPGTLLQPQVHRVWYDGRELLELEVRYTPEAGGDVWFFLFDPETFALSGYRFYHAAEGPGTGEYILLEDETEVAGLRLPAVRHWYQTAENRYLGTDRVVGGGVPPRR